MNLFERLNTLFKTNNRDNTQNSILHAIISQAKRAQYSEEYDHAIELYREAQKIAEEYPSNVAKLDVLLQLADALTLKGDYVEAEALLEKSKRLAELHHMRSPMAYTLCALGVVAQAKGELEQAHAYYDHARAMAKLIRSYGAQGRATAHLGDLALLENNLTYAIHLLREAIPLLQRSGDTELLAFAFGKLGTALIASGQDQQGKHVINNAIEAGLAKRQIAILRQLSLEAGERALANHDYTAAYHHYNNSLKLFPHPDADKTLFVHAHAWTTYAAIKLKKMEEAHRLMTATQSLAVIARDDQVLGLVYAMTGLIAYEKRDFAQTILHIQNAFKQLKDHPFDDFITELWLAVAHSQYHLNQPDECLKTLDHAIALSEQASLAATEAQLMTVKGDVYAHYYHRRTQALTHYQSAFKLYEQAGKTSELALLNSKMGLLEAFLGQGVRATKHLEQTLLELNTVTNRLIMGEAFENVADAYLYFGDVETAESLYTKAIAIAQENQHPEQEIVRRGKRGYLYALMGEAEKGVAELTLARNQSREFGLTVLALMQTSLLGVAYRQLGEINTALSHHYEAIAHLDYSTYGEEMAFLQLYLADTLLLTRQSMEQTKVHYQHAWDYAQPTDNQLLIYSVQLGLAKFYLQENHITEADTYLTACQMGIQKSNANRLLAELKILQSHYFALTQEDAKAHTRWLEAEKLCKIVHIPTPTPDWLA